MAFKVTVLVIVAVLAVSCSAAEIGPRITDSYNIDQCDPTSSGDQAFGNQPIRIC
ncbi:hypothetical protein NQ315_001000 [Exocentrus adspersus]|uniref:Uncharacterized protein n=1 Tax=Exocentrus adspersus TaxID=1586481 RepID=A0AAV8WFI2_9CUCU|nr:hypothetical protein NQ315_001000 [Exocentrus adspersus]